VLARFIELAQFDQSGRRAEVGRRLLGLERDVVLVGIDREVVAILTRPRTAASWLQNRHPRVVAQDALQQRDRSRPLALTCESTAAR